MNLKNPLPSLILLTFGGILLLMAVRRLRNYRLKERYALLFLAIGLPFVLLAFWPGAIGFAAALMGINYATVALLCVAIFLILTVFELLTIVSQQDRKITTLAQMVGILMEKQHELERPRAGEADLPGNGDPAAVANDAAEVTGTTSRRG